MLENSVPFIKSVHLDSFVSRDNILVWRADALAPCFLLAPRLFIMTRNFTAIYLDLLSFRSFTVTLGSAPLTGTGKKQGTATQTAPNQTAGPLAFMDSNLRVTSKTDFSRTSKSR
jgi:hypothetical protein